MLGWLVVFNYYSSFQKKNLIFHLQDWFHQSEQKIPSWTQPHVVPLDVSTDTISAFCRAEKAPGSVRADTNSLAGYEKQISAAHHHPHPTSPVCSLSCFQTLHTVLKGPFEAFGLYQVKVKGSGYSLLNVKWGYPWSQMDWWLLIFISLSLNAVLTGDGSLCSTQLSPGDTSWQKSQVNVISRHNCNLSTKLVVSTRSL